MARHLEREFVRLRKDILSLSAFVNEALQMAVTAIASRSALFATRVNARDTEIDFRGIEAAEDIAYAYLFAGETGRHGHRPYHRQLSKKGAKE